MKKSFKTYLVAICVAVLASGLLTSCGSSSDSDSSSSNFFPRIGF